MATQNIDTTLTIYQERLGQLQQIKTFYGPLVAEFLQEPLERQNKWAANDPLLWEILDLVRKANQFDTEGVLDVVLP